MHYRNLRYVRDFDKLKACLFQRQLAECVVDDVFTSHVFLFSTSLKRIIRAEEQTGVFGVSVSLQGNIMIWN